MDILWRIVGLLTICLGVFILIYPTLGKDKGIVNIRTRDIFWFLFLVFDGILVLFSA